MTCDRLLDFKIMEINSKHI